jgi:REase_DpnII-MboI
MDKRHLAGAMKFRFPATSANGDSILSNATVDPLLLGVCDRFHRAVLHLSGRRKGKQTISFSDEYDVQDVFGTVLKCCYDDVRDEEWTPSYAGEAARIDFVNRDRETAAELKRARTKQVIADELILDIAHYSKNRETKKLVCFVYDPDGLLRRDASQIEIDLSGYREHDGRGLNVIVLIRPK